MIMPQLSARIKAWVLVLENLCKHLNMTSAYIIHHDFKDKVSTSICQYTGDDSSPEENEAMPGELFFENEFPDTLGWLVSDTRQPHIVNIYDLTEDHPEYIELAESQVKTALFFKLMHDDEIWGYVELWDSQHVQTFSAKQLDYGSQVADKLAQTLKSWV